MATAPLQRKSLVKAMWSASGSASEAVLPGVTVPDSHVEFVIHLEDLWRMRRVDEQGWKPQPNAFVFAGMTPSQFRAENHAFYERRP